MGSGSLSSVLTGNDNIGIGYNAGDIITTGSKSVVIGSGADTSIDSGENEIVIGYNAKGHGNNIVVIGDTNINAIHPADDNGVDLGSSAYSFKNLYVDGTIYKGGNDYLSSITNSTITNSSLAIGTGNTLDTQNGTLTTSTQQKVEIVQGVGQDIDIGAFDLRAQTLTSDATTGTSPLNITSTTQVANLFATKAATVPVTDSTSTGCFVGLYESSSGDLGAKTNAGLAYNASTGTLTVSNLNVTGTTTTINSTVVDILDPVLTIGTNTSDNNFDRGIKFKWNNGSTAKEGFFGFDDTDQKFLFIPDATDSTNTFSGTAGTIKANLEGSVTLNGNIIPDTDNSYDIGSTTNKIKDLHVEEIYSNSVERVLTTSEIAINSGQIISSFTVPASALVTDIIGIFTVGLAGTGTLSVKIGSSTGGNEYSSDVELTGNNQNRGFNLSGTLGEIVSVNSTYFATQTTIHVTVFDNGGSLTAGAAKFVLKYVQT